MRAKNFPAPSHRATDRRSIPPLLKLTMPLSAMVIGRIIGDYPVLAAVIPAQKHDHRRHVGLARSQEPAAGNPSSGWSAVMESCDECRDAMNRATIPTTEFGPSSGLPPALSQTKLSSDSGSAPVTSAKVRFCCRHAPRRRIAAEQHHSPCVGFRTGNHTYCDRCK